MTTHETDKMPCHLTLLGQMTVRVCFGQAGPGPDNRQPGQRVTKTASSSIYGYVTSQHFRPLNQNITSNKKATFNLLKVLLGFKSIWYLMPGT